MWPKFYKSGGKDGYVVHSHPNVLKHLNDSYITADENHSKNDKKNASASTFADVVLEIRPNDKDNPPASDKEKAKQADGNWILRSDSKSEKIEIYNEKGTLYREDYSKYKGLMNKINNTPNTK